MKISNSRPKHQPVMMGQQVLEPLEKEVLIKRKSLLDLKSLLEDRGGTIEDRKTNSSNNRFYRLDNKVIFGETTVSDYGDRERCKRRYGVGRWCCSRIKTIMYLLLVVIFVDTRMQAEARSSEPRYETAYACEGKTLKIGCAEGSVIHLIRANYGRFSITICNDHGNTDWSVNCMSTRSLRVLHSRCSMHQNCSILASTNMFGDPCPNTLKYLEAHYQCVPASTTSTTNRPSPPWLITSQPTVWRSTLPPIPKSPVQTQQTERKKPTVITPPTFRPHITLPPEVKLGDIGTKKTTTRQPDSSSEREPPQIPHENVPEVKEEPKVIEPDVPKSEKPKERDDVIPPVTEETMQWPSKDEDSTSPVHMPPKENRTPDIDGDIFDNKIYSTSSTPNAGRRAAYCPQVTARGLHWNWTLAGQYAVQPCPGGATGLARWTCTLTSQHVVEERPRRHGAGLPSGENYRDLGLDQPSDRQLQIIRRLGSEALLKGRDGDTAEHMIDYRGAGAADAPHNVQDGDFVYGEGMPGWHGATPDLSECRSVWLNSLEARVREGESLLSISNDLAQVTSSKTLYGGDMMTTTSIMKKLAQRMSQNMQTFPDPRQRETFVADMLLGVIKTGSNLLEESQRASWSDLSTEAQNRVASALLTQLEENAFLLADAVTKEKTILQIVKNICLSVRVLEVKSVEDETFPSIIAQEQWKASEDTITIPKAALLDNRQNDLVRIVFFAFDRLEQILPPTFGKSPQFAAHSADLAATSTTINSEREKNNVSRVLNSKVISASLGNGRHIQLSQMVRLTMKHLKIENVTNPVCVFWDYTLHGWSPEGCQVEWSNLTHTGCACSHLTNFAILMDVHGVTLTRTHQLALRLITLVGCGISAVALVAAIIVFQCCRNMKSDRVLIHKHLCWCLLIAEVIFMVGIDQTQDRILCGIIAGLLHYFFLAAFAWMFLEGFHLYAMLVEVFEPERPRARWYCAGAYLAPALVVLASAAARPAGYGTPHSCWLSTDHLFIMSFVGPVALVVTANWICLGLVIYMMCHHTSVSIKAKENSKLYKIKVWLNTSIVLAVLLGLTWTFGVLYLNEQTVAMAYAFTILNSFQGLFIFVFHCLLNEIFQKECARLGRRHPWLSCCAQFAAPSQPPHLPATGSSSNHVDTRPGSVKSRRYHQSTPADEDVVDPRDVTSYNIQPESSRWNIRPTAPIYVPNDDARSVRVTTPQIPHSSSHTQSIASMHSYRNNIEVPNDYQNVRSRSPSCFSNKMAASIGANEWALMANTIGGNVWKNTSSKHHAGNTSTLPHHDTLTRQLQQNHIHSPYECDAPLAPLAPASPRHVKDEESPLHHPQGYNTTRSYNQDFRNPHVYMSQHSPGSQEMIFRKHYKDDRRKHHHGSQSVNHTYSEIASQQGRMYRRGSEQEFRVIQDDPVYEEIERNETLMSDMSDDNSGPDNCRQNPGHHGSSSSKFFGDHRPLISYSPGDRHHHEQEHYGKYGKWDTLDRAYDRHAYESGRLAHPYHQPQENNMRALAAVLNGENNVVCHLEPHNSYDVYQPQSGNPRTVSQPSF
ncbi:PREDICTED: latrophilin Cirl isoform X1 [Papilio xuthus]|uniref:Latrophilin Cirl isoform X1 n=1 Tax=Papilio xuthus TaxID=66420 RepID=A0AAJ7EEY9_PAPXU|nr:PREDICTED: latrophilin Cirl isoform X1 [Papilio xuthus]XP_013174759.1 PREDICTED: latrophilin Cirl isoform X1 [Papilio xuthus]